MARDDYFRVMCYILTQLYTWRRNDEPVDWKRISADGYGIPYGYWRGIMQDMADEGFIKGLVVKKYIDMAEPTVLETDVRITMMGIEFLKENSQMNKVREWIKTAPGIAADFAALITSI